LKISELEQWFTEKCDGDWEHQGGVELTTTDNPGWYVQISYDDMDFVPGHSIERENIERSDEDFIRFLYDASGNKLRIACGASNLSEAFALLRRAEGAPA